MKITKTQLKRIIKEEKRKISESSNLPGYQQDPGEAQDITDGFYNAINQMVWDDWSAAGVDPHENPEEMGYLIEALRKLLADAEAGNF
jgi:hypothetical protein